MTTRLNNFMYYNLTEIMELVGDDMDRDYITFCIDCLLFHYTGEHLTDLELALLPDWIDFIIEN